jgi:hypothetical protein
MLKITVFLILLCILAFDSYSFDENIFSNNKEIASRILRKRNLSQMEKWLKQISPPDEIKTKAEEIFKSALTIMQKDQQYCDLGFAELLINIAKDNLLLENTSDFRNFLYFSRRENIIDDLLLKKLIGTSHIIDGLQKREAPISNQPLSIDEEKNLRQLDLEKLFRNFRSWPDEKLACSVDSYLELTSAIPWKRKNELNRKLQNLHYLALEKKIITENVFRNLEIFRRAGVYKWGYGLGKYIGIMTRAKDKFVPKKPETFSELKLPKKNPKSRKALIDRGGLYQKFSSTQIIMLANIIQVTAKRIDAHYVAINFQYRNSQQVTDEVVVLSPMERYRLAIKMLRKDFADILNSENFKSIQIDYSDLVSAAFETGVIRSEDIEIISQFEDFWNPQVPKWKAYLDFTFSLLGNTTFYLPPPLNIIGALALVITQSELNKKSNRPDPNANWNILI